MSLHTTTQPGAAGSSQFSPSTPSVTLSGPARTQASAAQPITPSIRRPRSDTTPLKPSSRAVCPSCVLARDQKMCVMSGAVRTLQVHHIDHDPANNEMVNLITLSKAAHAQYHAMPGAQQTLWRSMFTSLAASRTS